MLLIQTSSNKHFGQNPNIESLTSQPKSATDLEAENMYKTAISVLQEEKDYKAYQLFSTIIKQYPESEVYFLCL